MVNSCCIFGCTNRATPGSKVTFCAIPAVIVHQGEKQSSYLKEDMIYGYHKSTEKVGHA